MGQSVSMDGILSKKMENESKKVISKISEIIENSDIGEDDKERIISIISEEEFKGPIPHPQILKQYEEIQPGFANEIVNMAVKEQSHRHEMDKILIESQTLLNTSQVEIIRMSIHLKSRLQIFGFVSTTILLIVGSACIFLDKNVGSISTFILAIASFCWTMFYGKKKDDEKIEEIDDKE